MAILISGQLHRFLVLFAINGIGNQGDYTTYEHLDYLRFVGNGGENQSVRLGESINGNERHGDYEMIGSKATLYRYDPS
jgi:hypothetical protein